MASPPDSVISPLFSLLWSVKSIDGGRAVGRGPDNQIQEYGEEASMENRCHVLGNSIPIASLEAESFVRFVD
jgi:hypothetical protein